MRAVDVGVSLLIRIEEYDVGVNPFAPEMKVRRRTTIAVGIGSTVDINFVRLLLSVGIRRVFDDLIFDDSMQREQSAGLFGCCWREPKAKVMDENPNLPHFVFPHPIKDPT